MYTWGYIKEATLVEMDMPLKTATEFGILNKFPFYANTIMTQICSAIKPKWTSQMFKVRDKDNLLRELILKYDVPYFNPNTGTNEYQLRGVDGQIDLTFLTSNSYQVEDLNYIQQQFYTEYKSYVFINEMVDMPDDYVSYSTEPMYVIRSNGNREEVYDTDFNYCNHKSLVFFTEGDYNVPYNARWYTFSPKTNDSTILNIPHDILDCLPLYIASQCLKVDDEEKAAILRRELEIAMSRIDNSHLVQNKTFTRTEGW